MGAASIGPIAPNPPKGWFDRNWKWVLPVGCLGFVLLASAFVGGIFLLVETSFRHSDAYTQALARVEADPQVIAGIGQPLKAGWLISGNINVSGSSGHSDLSIPISGPRGKGKIHVVASKNAGVWRFETLEVAIDGERERIDLLQEDRQAPVLQENL
jgi:Cytochrome oxidase complex assembly protein 1